MGPARRRADARTAAPEGEIFWLDPRAARPGETALIGKFRAAIGQRPIARLRGEAPHDPDPFCAGRALSVALTNFKVDDGAAGPDSGLAPRRRSPDSVVLR